MNLNRLSLIGENIVAYLTKLNATASLLVCVRCLPNVGRHFYHGRNALSSFVLWKLKSSTPMLLVVPSSIGFSFISCSRSLVANSNGGL